MQTELSRESRRLPDLDHSKLALRNRLTLPASRRVCQYAIDQFVAWYCSESLALPSIGLSSYVAACTWNRLVWPRILSTSSSRPCVAWFTIDDSEPRARTWGVQKQELLTVGKVLQNKVVT